MLILTHQQQTPFENIVGKEEIARNEQFLLFPQCFLLNQKIVSPFVNIFDIISLCTAQFEEPKIGIWGNRLMVPRYKPFETLWEDEKMLLTSIISFYPAIFSIHSTASIQT